MVQGTRAVHATLQGHVSLPAGELSRRRVTAQLPEPAAREFDIMRRSRGEHSRNPNSWDDDPPPARHSRRRRRHSTPKREHFDVRRAICSWSRAQLDSLRPWEYFTDTSLISVPRSVNEMIHRMEKKNADFFGTNYGFIFIFILAGSIVYSMVKVMSVMAICAVIMALSLHKDTETAFFWGQRPPLTKNQRVGVAVMAALPLLRAADIFTTVFWCTGVTMIFTTVHTTMHDGLCSPFK